MFNSKGVFSISNEPACFSFMMSGDCCPQGIGEELISAGKAENIVHEMAPLTESVDMAMLQLETPLTTANTPIIKSALNLKVHPRCIEFIKAGGFDTVTLANNHTGDFGPEALLETCRHLDEAGINHVGAGTNTEAAFKPLFINRNGFKLCIINAAEHEFGVADTDKPGINPLEPLKILRAIRKITDSGKCNALIVIIHGGIEFTPLPNPRMVETYRAFADAGASVVINMHSHCPQGVEIYNGVPIVYSLGNFYFPWPGNRPQWYLGYSVKIDLAKNGKAIKLQAHPHTFASDEKKVRRLSPEGCAKFADYLNRLSEPINDPVLIRKYFESWASRNGHWMIEVNKFTENWRKKMKTREAIAELMGIRNHFTCESHHELLSTFWRLIEEQRFEEAQAFGPEIDRLTNITAFYDEMKMPLEEV